MQKSVYFMGIGGVGMAGTACLLKRRGFRVWGSDAAKVYPPMSEVLRRAGIEVREGFGEHNLNPKPGMPKPDMVIIGNVVPRSQPEAKAWAAKGVPLWSWPQALREFVIQGRDLVVVAGTHGKTTSTALLVHTAHACGLNTESLVGGTVQGDKGAAPTPAALKGPFIIEGDEYDTAFFDKRPKLAHYGGAKGALLTGVEFDHADIYKNLSEIQQSFGDFVAGLAPDGVLVAYGDCANVQKLLKHAPCRVCLYGRGEHCDYRLLAREPMPALGAEPTTPHSSDKSCYNLAQQVVFAHGQQRHSFQQHLLGEHNALNALGVWALVSELGWCKEAAVLAKAVSGFKGVKRRLEICALTQGRVLVEDYAHHPRALEYTLETLGEFFAKKKHILFWDPSSNSSKRRVFFKNYQQILSHFAQRGGEVFIARNEGLKKVPPAERLDVDALAASAKGRVLEDAEHALSIMRSAPPSSVCVLVSSGGFWGLGKKGAHIG